MIRWVTALVALFAALVLPGLAQSERVMIQTGEHDGYTRIVVQLSKRSDWLLGRVAGGYGLKLARPDVELDTSRAFTRIRRERLLDLVPLQDGPGLILRTGCNCHVRAEEYLSGIIVVDLHDGPAPAGSLFETALDNPAAPASVVPNAPILAFDPAFGQGGENRGAFRNGFGQPLFAVAQPINALSVDITRDYSAPTASASGTGRRDAPETAGMSRTDAMPVPHVAGQGADQSADGAAGPQVDAARSETGMTSAPGAETQRQGITHDNTGIADSGGRRDPARTRHSSAVGPEADPARTSGGAPLTGDNKADSQLPSPAADPLRNQTIMTLDAVGDGAPTTVEPARRVETAPPSPNSAFETPASVPIESPKPVSDMAELAPLVARLAYPDRQALLGLHPVNPRVDAARDALLRQLSRAATQGLLDVAQPGRPLLPDTQASPPDPVAAEASTQASAVQRPGPETHLSINAETSIDRDSVEGTASGPVTPDGLACLPDKAFDVASWGDKRAMSQQLAEKRQALVGEFDVAETVAVRDLARLYLFFGFGAEAAATLAAFAVPVPDADLLNVMAESIDNGAAVNAGRLEGMTSCDTSAALWAVLAVGRLSTGDPVNAGAVVRSFSALPVHLRRLIGPPLAERFLAIGKEDAARALREAIKRVGGDPGPQTRLVDARLDLARNNIPRAEAVLSGVVAEDGPASPEALILLIDTQIGQGVSVDLATVETAAALAFEHRGTELGSRLARAEVLAKAASGDFDNAFDTLALQTRNGPDALPTKLDEQLFALLTAHAADASFLRHILGSDARLAAADLPRALRQEMADRMVDLGFPAEAQSVLAATSRPKPADRIILAKIALAEAQPGAALRLIEGAGSGPAAALIEAAAMTQLGYHAQAAAAFARAEAPDAAAAAGWRAGVTGPVIAFGSPAQQAAVGTLGRAASLGAAEKANTAGIPPPAQPLGPLARNRLLLEDSTATRQQLAALLDAFPMPAAQTLPPAP